MANALATIAVDPTASKPVAVAVTVPANTTSPNGSTSDQEMLAHVPASAREQAIADAQLRYTVRRYPRHLIRGMYHAHANTLYASHPKYRPSTRHGMRRRHYMPHTLVKGEATSEASTVTISEGANVRDSSNNRARGLPIMGMSREDVSGLMPEPRVAIERAGREMYEAEQAKNYAKQHRHGSVEMQHAHLRHRAAVKEFKRLIRLDRMIERAMAFEIGHHLRKDWNKRTKQFDATGDARLPEEKNIDDRHHLAEWWCYNNSEHRQHRFGLIHDQRYGQEHEGSIDEKMREHSHLVAAANDGRIIERDFGREGGITDKNGFDRYGFDRDGYDQYGFDKQGFNRVGSDRYGFDRQGRPHRGEHLAHCRICKIRLHGDRHRHDRSTADSVTVGNSAASVTVGNSAASVAVAPSGAATVAPSTAPSIVSTDHGDAVFIAPTRDQRAITVEAGQTPGVSIQAHQELHLGAREQVGDARLNYACHHHHCHASSDGYLGMLLFNFIRRGELHMTQRERMRARTLARQERRAVPVVRQA